MGRLTAPCGVLVVDKPRGPTSHDIVAGARRFFATRSVGHAGTLDPLATGVLVVLVGEATKLSPYATAAQKTYEATVALGIETDTLDAEGVILREASVPPEGVDIAQLELALERERLRTEQIPPQHSAIKVDGVRAHRAARRGASVDLPPRAVAVQELALVGVAEGLLTLRLTVSKGYYVRALARDLAAHLGLPGHLAALRRVASGPFSLELAASWPLAPETALLSLSDAARRMLPVAVLTAEGVLRARRGQTLDDPLFTEMPPCAGPSAWMSLEGALVAVGERPPAGGPRILRGFSPP